MHEEIDQRLLTVDAVNNSVIIGQPSYAPTVECYYFKVFLLILDVFAASC